MYSTSRLDCPNPGWMRRWNPFFLRRDEANGSILGATVMDFERRFSGSLETVLPITFEEIAA